MVTNTSNSACARRISPPFSRPAQPRPLTVRTSWPGSSSARSCGRDSSSRTRTGHQRVSRQFYCCDGLFTLDRGELVQELVQSLTAPEVVKQRLDGYTGADEDGRSAQDLWIAM